MSALTTNITFRIVGIAFVFLGYLLFAVAQAVFANRPGGPESDYYLVQAEVVAVTESTASPGRLMPTYAFSRLDGERVECPTNYVPLDAPRVGDLETLAVAKAPRPGSCGIYIGGVPAVADYLLPVGGILFMLFGGVLAVFAHKFKSASGTGDGGPGFYSVGGFGGGGGGGGD